MENMKAVRVHKLMSRTDRITTVLKICAAPPDYPVPVKTTHKQSSCFGESMDSESPRRLHEALHSPFRMPFIPRLRCLGEFVEAVGSDGSRNLKRTMKSLARPDVPLTVQARTRNTWWRARGNRTASNPKSIAHVHAARFQSGAGDGFARALSMNCMRLKR